MISTLSKRIQNEAYYLVLWQLLGVLVLAMFAWLIKDWHQAISVLLGGCCYGFANLIFVWRVFRYSGAQEMGLFMAAFFMGEMLKLILSAIFVLMIVKYLSVSLLSVLIGFIGSIVSFWVTCMWHFSKKVKI